MGTYDSLKKNSTHILVHKTMDLDDLYASCLFEWKVRIIPRIGLSGC